MKLTTSQIYHLIDLLEINIREKKSNPPSFMNEELIEKAISYDIKLIAELKRCLMKY